MLAVILGAESEGLALAAAGGICADAVAASDAACSGLACRGPFSKVDTFCKNKRGLDHECNGNHVTERTHTHTQRITRKYYSRPKWLSQQPVLP